MKLKTWSLLQEDNKITELNYKRFEKIWNEKIIKKLNQKKDLKGLKF